MIKVQLDENINSRKLAEACHAEERSHVRRFPNEWRGQAVKDSEVLERFMAVDALLLTIDECIAIEHPLAIPDRHPGILIVQQAANAVRTMTWKIAQSIIAGMKTAISDWDSLPWNNSIVTFCPSNVEVRHTEAGVLHVDGFLLRDADGWEDELRKVLH